MRVESWKAWMSWKPLAAAALAAGGLALAGCATDGYGYYPGYTRVSVGVRSTGYYGRGWAAQPRRDTHYRSYDRRDDRSHHRRDRDHDRRD